MKKTLKLKDSVISIEGKSFLIKSKNAILGLSFSESLAFTVDALKNSAGKREVDYIKEPQSFLPISLYEETEANIESSHELMNAVTRKDGEGVKAEIKSGNWTFVSADAENSYYGGAKVLKLSAVAENESYNLTFHAITYPECNVIRYWFDIKNLSKSETECKVIPVAIEINSDDQEDIYRAAWFNTANARQHFGRINEMDFGVRPPEVSISSRMTAEYIPLVIFF